MNVLLVLAVALATANPGELTALAGNGGLTVGLNAHGQVGMCRWPSPGYFSQVRYRPDSQAPAPGQGLMWGIRVADKTAWISNGTWKTTQRYARDDSTLIETIATLPESDVVVTQQLFVCSTRDILVARVTVDHAGETPILYWFADLSPCTRLIPELSIAEWMFDGCRDFAAFTPDQGKTICHFRPEHPGSQAWGEAERLAIQPDAPAWDAFGDGTWIACSSPNAVAGFRCASEADRASTFEQADRDALDGATAAVGPCHSVLALRPAAEGDAFSATVFVAFGKSRAEAAEALAYALSQGFATLLRETDDHWKTWLGPAVLPQTDDATIASCKRDLLTIAQCLDRSSHAVARPAASGQASLLDWTQDGAWFTLALDLAGYRDRAGAHASYLAGLIRTEGQRGKPYGSVPAACFANGTDSAPHLVLSADAAAWTLGAVWRHAAFLEGPARRTFLTGVWDKARLAADFLVGWTDGRTREPLPAFDRRLWRDAQSTDLLLAAYMGVDAAIRMAGALGNTPPAEWTRRKRDLDALLRFHCVDDNGRWKSDSVLPFWQREIAQTELPAWSTVVDRRIAKLDKADEAATASAACEAALVWEGRPDRLAKHKALLEPVSKVPFVDPLNAARHFIAASLIYAPPR